MSDTADQVLRGTSTVAASEFTRRLHPDDTNVKIDPFTIIMFASLITSVIKMLNECRETQDSNSVKQLSMYELTSQNNRLLQRTIRQNVGWWKWLRHRKHYTEALLKVGRSTKAENIDTLITSPPQYFSL